MLNLEVHTNIYCLYTGYNNFQHIPKWDLNSLYFLRDILGFRWLVFQHVKEKRHYSKLNIYNLFYSGIIPFLKNLENLKK